MQTRGLKSNLSLQKILNILISLAPSLCLTVLPGNVSHRSPARSRILRAKQFLGGRGKISELRMWMKVPFSPTLVVSHLEMSWCAEWANDTLGRNNESFLPRYVLPFFGNPIRCMCSKFVPWGAHGTQARWLFSGKRKEMRNTESRSAEDYIKLRTMA